MVSFGPLFIEFVPEAIILGLVIGDCGYCVRNIYLHETKHSADDSCIIAIEAVVTDGPPHTLKSDLNPSCRRLRASRETDSSVWICLVTIDQLLYESNSPRSSV